MTNPSTEQIEAALGYIDKTIDNCQDLPPDLEWGNSEVLEMLGQVRAELVAAAGVTPRGRGEVLQRAHEVIKGVYANELRIPAYMLSRQAALALKQDDLLAAPVQIDEAKLAEVLLPMLPRGMAQSFRCGLANELAAAVAGHLRGGGQ